jgi:uncharacterized damage-inducible protein DinB
MSGTAQIKMLTRYNAWANKKMFDAVAALPEGEAVKERTTLFKNMVNTLNHQYVVHLIWQAHLEGREHGIHALSHKIHTELAPLWEAQQAIDAWYIDWADKLTESQADETVDFTLIGGNQGSMRRGDIALHVITHCSYHRGWVADLFFQVPKHPPSMDLPVYHREMQTAATA